MSDLASIEPALATIVAPASVTQLLRDLHTQALSEPAYVSTDSQPASAALDRFVALEPEKCALVYLLLRSTGARFVVEAGTSFGVSTIYLALAVGQNAAALGLKEGKVIATENEATKARRARQHWEAAGEGVNRWIQLREGDLRETLATDLPVSIDFVLLDIWSALALPTLRLLQPHLKIGAMIVADNWIASGKGYADLAVHLNDPQNGFRSMTLPYGGGLHVAVYVGR